jgi:MoaA/NifB/PqqE/SkfB family radical SAM enzyme
MGWKHTQNALAEEVHLKSGYDIRKPVTFYEMVNEHCNVKCRYCEYWRLKSYQDEMTNEKWQRTLLSIKEFAGKFSINFNGGEPFIRRGFIDLLAWRNVNILAGVTTNGSVLTLTKSREARCREAVQRKHFGRRPETTIICVGIWGCSKN